MVDHCKIRAKTACLIEHERRHKESFKRMKDRTQTESYEPFYKPNLLPMDFVSNEEAMPKSFPSGFISPDWEQMLGDYKINTAVAQTNEEIEEQWPATTPLWGIQLVEKERQHLARLIRKGTKGFTE